ncbi:MAG: Phosphopantetheine adenylyltransferase [Firmicutes bacterium]|nr:Phosphopantetheine adenylyltransferase [Bacillota bacterium]
MRIAICPGSFDPVTNGHVDIFERASKLFDVLIIAVFNNPNKKPLFDMEERAELLTLATRHIPNVRIDRFSGLLTEYALQQRSYIIVRGLRALSDFEYEFQRALLIKKIAPMIETVFIMTSSEYSFVSSSGIKELAAFDGPITGLVPTCVEDRINKLMRKT